MTDEALILQAKDAMKNAYAPYSEFRVGSALLAKDGAVFKGCNVENASYGATNCAERTAVFKAVSEGYREFEKIAIVASSGDYASPCGRRQSPALQRGKGHGNIYSQRAASDGLSQGGYSVRRNPDGKNGFLCPHT